MTAPSPQPPEQERAALQTLVQALAYAQGTEAVVQALVGFPGITAEGIKLLLTIPQVRGLVRLSPHAGAHAATQAMYRLNLIRRAAYLTQASRRLSTATGMGREAQSRALVTERRYLLAHLRAQAGRELAANAVGATARKLSKDAKKTGSTWNGLLGWYATLDDRTSPECKKAHGRNFDPTQVPPIGFPGAVHPACRCRPGPPYHTDLRVEAVAPDHTARTAGPRRVTIGV